MIKENEKLKQEIEQYKQALCKFSPIEETMKHVEETGIWCFCCKFCKQTIEEDCYGHLDNCEYLRLCATDINVTTKNEVQE